MSERIGPPQPEPSSVRKSYRETMRRTADAVAGQVALGAAVIFVAGTLLEDKHRKGKEPNEKNEKLPKGVAPLGKTETASEKAKRELKEYNTALALARLEKIAKDQQKAKENEG